MKKPRLGAISGPATLVTKPEAVAHVVKHFPSFRDFVDDALFHPDWGYYSTGRVRFGEGGHYETFPLALSPVFGHMVARAAFRSWQRSGRPKRFEICEIGAGNGQLCVDVLASLVTGPETIERRRPTPLWQRFAASVRYRIVERSAALIARQRQQLGPLTARVAWTRTDLSRRAVPGIPFAACGFIVANEVLDCLAHHKVVPTDAGTPGVVFVVPVLETGLADRSLARLLVQGLDGMPQALSRSALPALFAAAEKPRGVTLREVALPLRAVPGLDSFLRQYCPELFARGRFPPYFACPTIPPLMRNTGRLYRHFEAVWMDYGETRPFHLRTPEGRRVFAGPPRSGATVYDNPGRNDITFMVDFTVVADAARREGFNVTLYAPQSSLASLARMEVGAHARNLITRARALTWLLAVSGAGPERDWRRTGLTWNRSAARGGRLSDSVQRSIDEFFGRRRSPFKLLVVRSHV